MKTIRRWWAGFVQDVGASLLFLLTIGLGLSVFLVFVILFYDGSGAFKQNCTDAGGHIYQPSTLMFCLTEDGRMLEVYP